MNILILHPNYPAQFKHLVDVLPSQGMNVRFVCQRLSRQPSSAIKLICLKNQYSHDYLYSRFHTELERSQARSEQYYATLAYLKSNGYQPDLVIGHSGWGCALKLREVWPHVPFIAYFEWWLSAQSDLASYDIFAGNSLFSESVTAKFEERNALVFRECDLADVVVTPTHWQRIQAPPQLKQKMQVIHEGVDRSWFRPTHSCNSEFLITYGTRGLEPMRGFDHFIRELISFLPHHPNVRVEIAGEDRCYYSAESPPDSPSWGVWAKSVLDQHDLLNRVRFLDRLPWDSYRAWLQSSSLHIYLTQPFVASWSLLEASATCQRLVCSDVSPVRELLSADAATFIDHRSVGWLSTVFESHFGKQISSTACSRRSSGRYCSSSSIDHWLALICQLKPTRLD